MVASEAVFVPRPDGEEEDDGVVLSYIFTADGMGYVVVLDGSSL